MKTGKIVSLAIAVLAVVMFAGAAYCFLGGADPSRNMGNYRSFSFYADRPGNAAAGWFQPGVAPPSPSDEFWFDNSGDFNLPGGMKVQGPVVIGTAIQTVNSLSGLLTAIANPSVTTIIMQPGTYTTNAPIIGRSNLTIMSLGHYNLYGNSEADPIVIKTGSSFPAGEPIFDLQGCTNTTLMGLQIQGNNTGTTDSPNGTSVGIALGCIPATGGGNLDGSSCTQNTLYSNHLIKNCSITSNAYGVESVYGSYNIISYNNIAANTIGVSMIHAGDSQFVGNHFNSNGFGSNVSPLTSCALSIAQGSGNSSVIGGKIEWNNCGLVINSGGITVSGVNFDTNAVDNVYVYNDYNAVTLEISNCHFLGGGFGTAADQAHIEISDDLSQSHVGNYNHDYPINLILQGNSFKMTRENTPFPYDSEDPIDSTTGPHNIIFYYGNASYNSPFRLTMTGNDFDNASIVQDIMLDGTVNPRSYIDSQGNSGNFHITGNAPILTFSKELENKIAFVPSLSSYPTMGNWKEGDVVRLQASNPSSGTYLEKVCVQAGTLGLTLSGVTATASAGAYTATLSSAADIFPGDYITIAGAGANDYEVLSVDYINNTVTISNSITNAVSGAAVAFAAPVWDDVNAVP